MPETPQNAAPAWRTAGRRVCIALATAAIAVMAWSAVHDILRGEHDLTAEWTFLVFAGLLGACSGMTWLMRAARARR